LATVEKTEGAFAVSHGVAFVLRGRFICRKFRSDRNLEDDFEGRTPTRYKILKILFTQPMLKKCCKPERF
jgi:hypothetical protein